MLRLALLAAVSTLFLSFTPVLAADDLDLGGWQDHESTAAQGQTGYTNGSTWGNQYGDNGFTGTNRSTRLQTSTGTGLPIPGTNIVVGNLANWVEKKSPITTLPITNLDSIVAQSGYSDIVFGDEGTEGPPPYSSFGTIDAGIHATTGHKSDAPSAWY
jgi:hypothetical protein